jgi:hypothetical protein
MFMNRLNFAVVGLLTLSSYAHSAAQLSVSPGQLRTESASPVEFAADLMMGFEFSGYAPCASASTNDASPSVPTRLCTVATMNEQLNEIVRICFKHKKNSMSYSNEDYKRVILGTVVPNILLGDVDGARDGLHSLSQDEEGHVMDHCSVLARALGDLPLAQWTGSLKAMGMSDPVKYWSEVVTAVSCEKRAFSLWGKVLQINLIRAFDDVKFFPPAKLAELKKTFTDQGLVQVADLLDQLATRKINSPRATDQELNQMFEAICSAK